MRIRLSNQNDSNEVRRLYLSSFPEGESEAVARIAVDLLTEETSPPVLSLVLEVEDAVVGHVAFSPVAACDTKEQLGYILAPLAVRHDRQGQGIASRLIENGMERLVASGVGLLLVYGDPGFYGRFGFHADGAGHYLPPYELHYSFGWQARVWGDFEAPTSPVQISCVCALRHSELW